MSAISKQRIALAISVPSFIFISCTLITFSEKFQQHSHEITQAVLIDMLLIAPLLYYAIIYKTAIAKATVLRVFLVGGLLATVILPKSNLPEAVLVKTFLLPIAELLLFSYIAYKLYSAKKRVDKQKLQISDFLTQTRAVLTFLLGGTQIANVMAAEIAVFYYAFCRKDRMIDNRTKFTCYKENGISLILKTFLALFIIELVGMHFLFLLWHETAAWVLTSLSVYSCLQLYAHIRSLKARPIILTCNELHLRNGILGGDVVIQLHNINKIVLTSKNPIEPEVIKLALIKGLEKHNLAIYLKEHVSVFKAFGIKKTGKILLINIDKPKDFMAAFNSRIED